MAASVSSACSSTDTTVPRSRDRHSYLHTALSDCLEVCALTIVSGTHCVKQPRSSVPRAKSCSARLAF